MLRLIEKYILTMVVLFVVAGCADHSLEHDFFQKPFNDAKARMANYSLEDQYKIFRYGNDIVHPPMTELADPIAKQGHVVVPFLLKKLASETDDEGVRDIVLIFEWMAIYKVYDVKSDPNLMEILSKKVDAMRTWKDIALNMMAEIKSAQK